MIERRLIRVVSATFVAGFETDGTVITSRCAPILRRALAGRSDEEARRIIKAKGWKASVVPEAGSMRALMKSNGGRRGAAQLRGTRYAPPPKDWIPCSDRLPDPAPGYTASVLVEIRDDLRITCGAWHPGNGVWIDQFGFPLERQPTHWRG